MKEKETIKNVIRNRNVSKNQRIVSGPDYRDLGAILLFIFLLPYIVSFFFGNAGKEAQAAEDGIEEGIAADYNTAAGNKLFEDKGELHIFVCNTTAAGTETMPLETYLVCRLPSTIDMNYEKEALKAQAVVLRTELMRICSSNGSENNGSENNGSENNGSENNGSENNGSENNGSESKSSENEDRENKSRKDVDDNNRYIYIRSNIVRADGEIYERAKEAVENTRGMYMTYQRQPIKAPYFALSAGATRNGNEVFNSNDYEYLKSVMCERDFTSDDYNKSIKMRKSAFFERLNEITPGISAQRDKGVDEIISITRDRAGYVAEIGIGDKYISGEAFRNTFELASSCFEISEEMDGICIKTKGVGHGLGFCQYGANEAARKGSDYIDILNYFFSDIVIEKTE